MIGLIKIHKGQEYWVASTFMRPRADGSHAVIAVWASTCTDCGAPFEFTVPATSDKFEPNRRCQAHKRPGRRVRRLPC